MIDDRKNRAKLVSLLRFRTSASEGKEVSLASYVSRMKEGQKRIFYMTGESDEKIKNSPFLEKVCFFFKTTHNLLCRCSRKVTR